MEFVPFAAAGLLIIKFIDVLRYASARDVNAVLTQTIAWLAGIAGVSLLAHTVWAHGVVIAGAPLSGLGLWSQVFYGMSLSSAGSLVTDFKKAVDNTTSAAVPTLLSGRYPATHRAGKAPQ